MLRDDTKNGCVADYIIVRFREMSNGFCGNSIILLAIQNSGLLSLYYWSINFAQASQQTRMVWYRKIPCYVSLPRIKTGIFVGGGGFSQNIFLWIDMTITGHGDFFDWWFARNHCVNQSQLP